MQQDGLFNDFIGFSHAICQYADRILAIDDQTPPEVIVRVTSHPFLSILLPALTSNLVIMQPESHYLSSICINLCGDLLIMLKRLVYAHDRREPLISSSHKDSGFVGPLSNHWFVKRNNGQGYYFSIDHQEIIPEISEKEVSKFRRYIKISGTSTDNTSVDRLSGVVFGTRVSFSEMKNGSVVSNIDGRISLDGTSIVGVVRDVKSSVSGKFEAVSLSQVLNPYNLLYRSALLTAMAFSKLTSHMINGLKTYESGLVKKSAVPSPDSVEHKNSATWLHSELLSGGLQLNPAEIRDLVSDISISNSPARLHNPSRDWWIHQVFPKVFTEASAVETVQSENLGRSVQVDSSSVPKLSVELYKQVMSHKGVSPLIKRGGEQIDIACQKVILVLIKHTGTASLCAEEEKAYSSGAKKEQDRPSSILMEIWRAGKLITEDAVRFSHLNYPLACSTLVKKSDFLMKIECNTKCKALSRSIQLSIQELVSPTLKISETISNLQEDISAIIKNVREFFGASVRVEELVDQMTRSKSRAIYRAASFRSIYLLTQKNDTEEGKPLGPVTSLPLLFAIALGGIQTALQKGEADCSELSEGVGHEQNSPVFKSSCGHYSDSLPACGLDLAGEVRSAFEVFLVELSLYFY
jgi:hypothetical protein